MGRDEAGNQERWGTADVIQFGRARRPSWWPSWRWPVWLALALLVAVAVLTRVSQGRRAPAAPLARPAPPPAVQVSDLGHPLLDATPGWDLFGLGPDSVVRIQPARGQVTYTAIPALQSDGPVAFLAGPTGALIRPLDIVPGYLVPDGRPPRGLPAVLSHGGDVVPAPQPGQVWVLAAGSTHMTRYALAGGAVGPSVPLPPRPWVPVPDGRGGVLLQEGGALYDAGPGGVRLVMNGAVVAVGPTRWLAVRCVTGQRCPGLLIDPAHGTRHILARQIPRPAGFSGVIAPDGKTAAVFSSGADGRTLLQLIDLSSGAAHPLPVMVRGRLASEALAWSPDSRWLFTVAENGKLLAVDTRTGKLHDLGITLPPLTELAIRKGPPG